ncbi:hypothetical protein BJV78DRAFT_658342 [Lactifluus subvellereus]|nr:hypothetical protein BJV78DRAFT_658342 [Lactifluus subvellereus]
MGEPCPVPRYLWRCIFLLSETALAVEPFPCHPSTSTSSLLFCGGIDYVSMCPTPLFLFSGRAPSFLSRSFERERGIIRLHPCVSCDEWRPFLSFSITADVSGTSSVCNEERWKSRCVCILSWGHHPRDLRHIASSPDPQCLTFSYVHSCLRRWRHWYQWPEIQTRNRDLKIRLRSGVKRSRVLALPTLSPLVCHASCPKLPLRRHLWLLSTLTSTLVTKSSDGVVFVSCFGVRF